MASPLRPLPAQLSHAARTNRNRSEAAKRERKQRKRKAARAAAQSASAEACRAASRADLANLAASSRAVSSIDLTRLKTRENIHKVLRLLGMAEACRDSTDECAGWAASGECTSNPQYMRANCAASCGTC